MRVQTMALLFWSCEEAAGLSAWIMDPFWDFRLKIFNSLPRREGVDVIVRLLIISGINSMHTCYNSRDFFSYIVISLAKESEHYLL